MAYIPTQASWDTLLALSEQPVTMSQLAKRIKKSLPYTLNLVKLLVAFGLVTEKDVVSSKPGKPAKMLTLVKTTASVRLAGPGVRSDKDYTPSSHQAFLLGLAGLKDTSCQAIATFVFKGGLLERCERIGLVRETPKIELVLVTDEVEQVRKKYSAATLDISDAPIEIACWTHSPEEISEGVKTEDTHFTLMDRAQTLFRR